jgi:hypothetical protein
MERKPEERTVKVSKISQTEDVLLESQERDGWTTPKMI